MILRRNGKVHKSNYESSMTATGDVQTSGEQIAMADQKLKGGEKAVVSTDLERLPSEKEGQVIDINETEYSPVEYKKILRKIDRFLLPLMWFCYGIQQTDKTSLGTQAIFGLREDTGLGTPTTMSPTFLCACS